MRHNSILSYRSDKIFTLAFFTRLFFVLLFAAFLLFQGTGLYSQQGGVPEKKTGDNVSQQTSADVKGDEKVPGEGFTDTDFGPQVEEESVSWMIFKTLMVLALFAGGFYMFYRFVTQKAGLQISGHEAIKILSMVPVGPNRTLQLIDVAGSVFLIGVSESGINMLTEIKDREEIDRIRLLSSRSTPVKDLTFQDFISDQVGRVVDRLSNVKDRISEKKSRGRGKATVQEFSENDFDLSYLSRQKNRLKSINDNDEE